MDDALNSALRLVTGRWESQILYVGVKLDIVESLAGGSIPVDDVAQQLELHPANCYRLMRAMASIGVLQENEDRKFALSDMGELFRSDHPATMRGMILWEESAVPYRSWMHLADVIREGGDDGCRREYGMGVFDKITTDAGVGSLFNGAMTSYTQRETADILAALEGLDTSGIEHICDIGGGRGQLIGSFLQSHEFMRATVLELPATLEDPATLLAETMGVADRCSYVAGDMFAEVPMADAYFLKHILHDWNDEECTRILGNARDASGPGARVFIAEYVVPGPGTPDFSKLFDVHMMAMLSGRERTETEFMELLAGSGWQHSRTWTQPAGSLSVIEGVRI